MGIPILGANSASGAYEISNSLRFNDDDSPKVSRSISSSGSARNATLSVWVKRGNLGTRQQIYSNKTADSSFSAMNMYFNASNDRLYIDHHDGSSNLSLYTTQVFRDVSSWYHIVHTIDTTTATATNRLRLYVNGTEVTDFATDNNPSLNADLAITNSTGDQSIGDDPRDSSDLFDGYMAEYNFVDGTTLDPTYFGEFNDNGVWIPKRPNVSSYGTNGFYLEFKQTGTSANSSGIGADTSGNDNHMSVTNLAAIDVTTDTPTNNFSTMNPLANYYAAATYSEGNCKVVTDGTSASYAISTFGLADGKWYAEFKASAKSGGADWFSVGIAEAQGTANNVTLGRDTGHTSSANNGQIGYLGYGTNFVYQNDAYYATSYSTAAYGVGDIIGVALDATNRNVIFYKNGTAQNSGTAFTIGAAPTGFWHFAVGDFENQNYTWECNFGQPTFSISSGNADANGYGNFEYSVPSGYYACCTKNLAEFG